ncbi:MAG: hypothetical protein IJB89_00580 [Akkermansia sp.]|nr:hypothetical protein [Akkermansia sp.]
MKFSPDGESEIIRVADSEIVPCGTVKLPPPPGGGSDEEWQPKGLRKDNTAAKGRNFTGSPEPISPDASWISFCPQGQNFTTVI